MELMTVEEFKTYIDGYKFTRKIKKVQLHHTYSPSYKNFNGSNHQELHQAMKNYHIKNNGWADIAQNITIFPDGKVLLGRELNKAPAGIYGANSDGICIECLGNFDIGGDVMTDAQKNAIVGVIKILLDKLGLDAYNGVTYHAWWTSTGSELGTYIAGTSVKTCPGTNFFGGNTIGAYITNLLPMIENYGKEECEMALKPITEINDIVWELADKKIITDSKLWMKKCESDINVYWLCRKMANYLRGTTE